MNMFTTALFLSVVIKAILDYVAEPIRARYPQVDLWWFSYVALVFGGLAAWAAGLNLFVDIIAVPWLGQLLTAFLVGGGAKLINDVFATAPALPTTTHNARVAGTDEVLSHKRPVGW